MTGEVNSLIDFGHWVYPEYVTYGDPFWLRMTFESETPATQVNVAQVNYYGILRLQGQVGDLTFDNALPPDSYIDIWNHEPHPGWPDHYGVFGNIDLFGYPTLLIIEMEDRTGTAFDSFDLPQVPPPLDAFDDVDCYVQITVPGGPTIMPDILTFSVVPEPGGLAMIAFGAAALMARRGRRNRCPTFEVL